ncbi:hypothetical protein Cni_G22382 [Canna indica]|uniref:Uncharacterized protein n=1 Tax=Canna indica TaxID=4628 RepID=A0AAQ3KU42_9LILI|nr:hypothetical protein Cni_G22382 [Canna indica]
MGGCESCFKPKAIEDEPKYVSGKVRPSDEDRGQWVGDFDVDNKATAFIAKFHETRVTDLESHETRVINDHEKQAAVV